MKSLVKIISIAAQVVCSLSAVINATHGAMGGGRLVTVCAAVARPFNCRVLFFFLDVGVYVHGRLG